MNSRNSLILNVVLSIAVIVLYILHFTGSPAKESSDTATVEDVWIEDTTLAQKALTSNRPLKVVFIRADSIYVKYEYFTNLKKASKPKLAVPKQSWKGR